MKDKKEERTERWLQTDPKVIELLSPDMKGHVKAKVKKHVQSKRQNAKRELANSRSEALTPRRGALLPEGVIQIIVVVASTVIFGTAAKQLADAAGRGSLAAGAGLLGGAIAGFLADEHGKRVFTSIAMKKSYEEASNHQYQLLADSQTNSDTNEEN